MIYILPNVLAGGDREVRSNTSVILLQVHGRTEMTTKAVEVELSAASLNTNDCFVLVDQERRLAFVWLGKGSTGDEREMAKMIAGNFNADHELVYEGML